MNNVKSIAVARDGNMIRMAVTYDVIDGEGMVVEPNKKLNRIVTDDDALSAIEVLNGYAQELVDEVEG